MTERFTPTKSYSEAMASLQRTLHDPDGRKRLAAVPAKVAAVVIGIYRQEIASRQDLIHRLTAEIAEREQVIRELEEA